MTQKNRPFENDVAGVASLEEIRDQQDPEDGDDDDVEPVVYLDEGRQLGYGIKAAWQVAW